MLSRMEQSYDCSVCELENGYTATYMLHQLLVIWRLEIEGNGKTWKPDERIRLRHIDTSGYLHSHDKKYTRIAGGQQEVCGIREKRPDNVWLAAEGVYLPVNNSKYEWQFGKTSHPSLKRIGFSLSISICPGTLSYGRKQHSPRRKLKQVNLVMENDCQHQKDGE
ncbi:hypothetical protein ZIOFF_002091 [Zingiber officinale]|uniref:MIR domain-containing protein n=1 Tax=Zingiber officinale TaxID=94328 RepID=A0A8J5I6V3_ZINOF|nr:hypothetical protein ZIOFF_002091 [Zingiber officinale]